MRPGQTITLRLPAQTYQIWGETVTTEAKEKTAVLAKICEGKEEEYLILATEDGSLCPDIFKKNKTNGVWTGAGGWYVQQELPTVVPRGIANMRQECLVRA